MPNFVYALSFFACATAVAVFKRDVFSPTITYPTASTIWNVGEVHHVKWSVANAPPGFPLNNATGQLLLGFLENGSENLDIDHPLADKFLLKTEQVQITVPNVKSRDDYIVVLLGDSGNASPGFTIHNITISGPPSSSSSSTSGSTSGSGTGASSSSTQTSPGGTSTGTAPASIPTITDSAPVAPSATPLSPVSSAPTGPSLTTLVVAPSDTAAAVPTQGSTGTGSAPTQFSKMNSFNVVGMVLGSMVFFLF